MDIDCPQATLQTPEQVKCKLAGRNWYKKEDLCNKCIPQWIDGKPPTKDTLTPVLYNIENIQPARPNPQSLNTNISPHSNGVGLGQKIKNLASAVWGHTLDSFRNVTPEEKQRRLEICEGCDKMNKEKRECNLCGCNIDIKIGWASSFCPANKWGKVERIEKPKGGCGCSGDYT